eukprot:14945951-Alexandrium_andersonii.AAC.1
MPNADYGQKTTTPCPTQTRRGKHGKEPRKEVRDGRGRSHTAGPKDCRRGNAWSTGGRGGRFA